MAGRPVDRNPPGCEKRQGGDALYLGDEINEDGATMFSAIAVVVCSEVAAACAEIEAFEAMVAAAPEEARAFLRERRQAQLLEEREERRHQELLRAIRESGKAIDPMYLALAFAVGASI